MNAKKTMLAVMCSLLVVVMVMAGIFISRVSVLLQGLGGMSSLGGSNTTTGKPADPGHSTQTQPSGTDSQPTTTVPPITQPSTTEPTEPDHVHEYEVQETVAATCGSLGYDIMVCTGCGRQDIQNFADALGHNFGPGETIEATCTEHGCTRAKCYRCGEIIERNYEYPLGHDYQLVESVTVTCETPGYDKSICSRCGDVLMENEVAAPGHSLLPIGEAMLPDCTTEGSQLVQCTLCGGVWENTIPAAGHTYGDWTVDAGKITSNCEVCQAVNEILLTDLKITNEEIRSAEQERMLVITVGTDALPNLLQFTILDRLNNGSLVYVLTADQGLVITYQDSTGASREVARYFNDLSVIVLEDGAGGTVEPQECSLNLERITITVGESFTLKLLDPQGNKLETLWLCDSGGVVIAGDTITGALTGEHQVYTIYEGKTYICTVLVV